MRHRSHLRVHDGARDPLLTRGPRAQETVWGRALRNATWVRRLGWQPFAPAEFVNWCGHAQEFVPIPEAEGERCWLIPILGEAT
jgi:hypothetical protein